MREKYEWIHSWCDETQEHNLPRVLLVGDSIAHGYQEKVRERLRGICRVDYVATSYPIDSKFYNDLVMNFVKDANYDIVHFNHGLHGAHMCKRMYKSRVKQLTEKIAKHAKVVLATTTLAYEEGNKKYNAVWHPLVKARNAALYELAAEKCYVIDDLFTVSKHMPASLRFNDGFHYLSEGYEVFADAVCDCIKENL